MSHHENILNYFFIFTPLIITFGFWIYYIFLTREKNFYTQVLHDGIWADFPAELSKETKEKILRAIISARTQQAKLTFKDALLFSGISLICIAVFWPS